MTFSTGTPLLVNVTKAVMVAAPIALLYFLLHKGQRKKRIISAGCMVLCAVYLVWFYFPYRYPSDPEDVQQFEVTSETVSATTRRTSASCWSPRTAQTGWRSPRRRPGRS